MAAAARRPARPVGAHPPERRGVGVDRDRRARARVGHAVDVGGGEVDRLAGAEGVSTGRAADAEPLLADLAARDGERAVSRGRGRGSRCRGPASSRSARPRRGRRAAAARRCARRGRGGRGPPTLGAAAMSGDERAQLGPLRSRPAGVRIMRPPPRRGRRAQQARRRWRAQHRLAAASPSSRPPRLRIDDRRSEP